MSWQSMSHNLYFCWSVANLKFVHIASPSVAPRHFKEQVNMALLTSQKTTTTGLVSIAA